MYKVKVFSIIFFILLWYGLCAQADIGDGEEFVEVRRLLDEIKVAAIEKHGAFYDPMEVARTKPRAKPFTDGTEASANWELTDQLFENDILLTLPQAKHILDEVKSSGPVQRGKGNRRRQPRQALPTPSSFWPSLLVSYAFQYDDNDWKNLIRSGLRHVESHTCIRFTESSSSQDYLQYIRGSGCWSSVGRTGGRQQVSIGYGCDALGIVAHETLHALGLWHEQSRTDRDAYININFDEIYPGTQSNFEKRTPSTSDNMGQPYDLGSVMHYGSKAFAIDYNAYSVITRDSSYQQTVGQRAGISFKDAKMINLRYCSRVCTQKLACQNGGYTDPNNCNQCKCPDGYGGTHCQQIPQSNVAACRGGEYTASTKLYYITSPQVTSRASCYYRIKAPANQRIELTINKINFPCKDACESYVELKYKLDKIATGARLCCTVPKSPIISESNEVLMIFKGEDNIPTGYEGFRITYRLVGAPTTAQSTTYGSTFFWNGQWWRWIKGWAGGRTHLNTKNGWDLEGVGTTNAPPAPGESTESSTSVATTTTTSGSTTHKPDPTPSPSPSGSRPEWSDWAAWSECSANCGGCGERKRLRACYGGDRKCSGLPHEISKCGTQPCPVPAGKSTSRCSGRLLLPCDLYSQLEFGTVFNNDETKTNDLAKSNSSTIGHLLDTPKNARTLRRIGRSLRHKRSSSKQPSDPKVYCERRFSYNCPTSRLTISMDWKSAIRRTNALVLDDEDDRQYQECCPGFYSTQGQCQPNA
ncbi:astacin (Peptidase family m12A) domain-containing protein [Ditylenchus destructor]|nr:astacin (Peptidase family m12A) domain-containing protein [Ditylenchus destructor]